MKSKLKLLRLIFACTIFCAFFPLNTQADNNLKYFGYWYLDRDAAGAAAAIHTNLMFVYIDDVSHIQWAHQHNQKVIVVFPDNNKIFNYSSGYFTSQQWLNWVAAVQPYINDIAAIFLIDEPELRTSNWNYIKTNIEQSAAAIRPSFPNTPLYVNFLPPTYGIMGQMPVGIDWISFDCYGSWNRCWAGYSMPEELQRFKQFKQPNQKIVLIPQAFNTWNAEINDFQNTEQELADYADSYFAYAQNDVGVIAIIPWLWGDIGWPGFQGSHDPATEPSLRELPLLQQKYAQIGDQILAMQPPPADITAPSTPTNLSATAVSISQINLSWTASTDNVAVSGYRVERCQVAGCSSFTQISTPSTNSYSDTGLTPNTSYTYKVRAVDNSNNFSGYSSNSTATTQAPADTTAPIISSIIVQANATNATISWDTNELSSSQIDYGPNISYGNSTNLDSTLVTTHSQTITNLNPGTIYHFKVKSQDAAGNLAKSSDQTFTTNPPPPPLGDTTPPSTPANLVSTVISSSQINLNWTASTDPSAGSGQASGVTGYQVDRCQGANCSNFNQIATPVSNSFSATSLTPSTAYSFRVKALDAAGNLSAYSLVVSATTQTPPDTTAPVISAVNTANITSSGVTITWTTNESATSLVEYGTTASYGSTASSLGSTSHGATLTNLSANTTYHYRLKATDAAGNAAVSGDGVITTKAVLVTPTPTPNPIPTPPPPPTPQTTQISNFKATSAISQVSLSWTKPSSSNFVRTLIVRKEGSPPSSINDGIAIYEGVDERFVDTNLSSGKTYYYSAFSLDRLGSFANPATISSTAGSIQPTTPTKPAANLKLISLNGTYYLIIDGVRHGITNPGLLTSYGFNFSMGKPATADDLAMPEGELLAPNEGILAKTSSDNVVWLVSAGQRRGFTSQSVFIGLGFKFSSVLIITSPELNKLPIGSNLDNPSSVHPEGVDINLSGTIYWLHNNTLYPYPSLAVYNSWRVPNDFSRVLPANNADRLLNKGSPVEARSLNQE